MRILIVFILAISLVGCASSHTDKLLVELETLNTNLKDIKTELEQLRAILRRVAISLGVKPSDLQSLPNK